MKIDSLRIKNFRGIRNVEMNDLGDMIIVAGQNGSGKSCIFDGIRLLKSFYGGYQHNEWQQWMGEFQIQLSNRSSDFKSMFNDAGQELRISCDFKLHADERDYIIKNSEDLLRETVWRTILPEAYGWGGFKMGTFASHYREREPEVAQRAETLMPILIEELARNSIRGECFILPQGVPQIVNSVALSVIFSTFRPKEIGVIDYHGAQRHYGREFVQGINLNLDSNEQQRSQHTLYNYVNKYNNVKSEMAASYVKEILAEQAGFPRNSQSTLTNTLKELFKTFFPEKEFLGPQPTLDGGLSFPVRTLTGGTHDLDELSAGEKEILYGYLRIRNSAPRFSIILLDEPELHLNPRLIRGLPQFYHRNLGAALSNQIWLVSHSDALLREVVGRERYNVFHMLPAASLSPQEPQIKPLNLTADLELALVDLVGDLAAYRPGGKVVIFEGGGDSDFDQRVTARLFPELQEQANLISGSNKTKVRALHETLNTAAQKGQLPFQFYSITDRDSDPDDDGTATKVNYFKWDVYHIENYLLDASFIRKVLLSINTGEPPTEEVIWEELREAALGSMSVLIRHELSEIANTALRTKLNVGTDPKKGDVVGELRGAVERSLERLKEAAKEINEAGFYEGHEKLLKDRYNASLADGKWISVFRGRDILKRFASKWAPKVSYEIFRNLILSKMADEGYQPDGMKSVIDKVLES